VSALRCSARAAALLASLTAVLLGCTTRGPVERISCIGDSITQGFVRGGANHTARFDPEGGYPGRLRPLLGPSVQVSNRGIGGSSARVWLADPHDGEGNVYWNVMRKGHDDLATTELPKDARSLVDVVIQHDRPQLVIIQLGINDIGMARLAQESEARKDEFVEQLVEQLRELERQASRGAQTVLVATLLPNHRDPDDVRRKANRRIRETFPDALPLGEKFEAAGWENLLADLIHPNEAGHQLLAETVAEELESRGLVRRRPATSPTTSGSVR
jgi:lysophospholipase L1-like esterase